MVSIEYDNKKDAFYLKGDTYKIKDDIKNTSINSSPWKWSSIVDGFWATKNHQLANHSYITGLVSEISFEAIDRINVGIQKDKDRLIASAAHNSDIEIPCREGLAYKPYQKAGIAFMLRSSNILLADEMRLGKTIQVIGYINSSKSIQKTLLICPSTLKLNWAKEFSKWLTRPFKIHIHINVDITGASFSKPVKGSEITYGTVIPKDTDIIIINYEQTIGEKMFNELMSRNYDLLVVDESHRLKSMKTKRTKSIIGDIKSKEKGIIEKSWKKIFITGTPIPNRPIEIWPTLFALCPEKFGDYWKFAIEYCGGKSGKHVNVTGASNLEKLQEELRSSVMVRRLRQEVLTELSAKEKDSIIIPVDAKDVSELVTMESTEYEKTLGITKNTMLAFSEIAKIRHEIALKKVPFVIEYISDFLDDNEGQKVVVFAHHKDVIKEIYDGLDEYNPVMIIGDMNPVERSNSEDSFRHKPTSRVIVCSILAAGVGIDLSAASTIVFAEMDWVPGNMAQAEDRVINIHKKDTVFINFMVFDGSLDEKMVKTLMDKQKIADTALNI